MAHRLQIRLDIDPQVPSEVKPLLANPLTGYDALRGVACRIGFTIKNLGTASFPGGNISNLELSYEGGVNQTFASQNVPQLAPSESAPRIDLVTVPLSVGVGKVAATIAASDGQPTEYFQRREDAPLPGARWLDVFYVADRELLNLILATTQSK